MSGSNVGAPWVASVIQGTPVPFDQRRTLAKVDDLVASAVSRHARLVVFPEAFVGGYPKGHVFGSYVGGRSDEGRDTYREYWESAIDVPGPCVDDLAAIAGRHGVHMVIGVIERDAGTLYCCVLFFGPTGDFLGKHRKLMPTGSERLIWGYGDGSTMPVLDTALGKLGAVICWENYMPMMRTAMYAKGIQLYCAPTADSRPSWIASCNTLPSRADVMCWRAISFSGEAIFPPRTQVCSGTIPTRWFRLAGAASSIRLDKFWRVLHSAKKPSLRRK